MFSKLIKAQRNSKEAVWGFVIAYIDINLSQERHKNILITLCPTAEVVEIFRKFTETSQGDWRN